MAEGAPNPDAAPGEEFVTSMPDSWRASVAQRSSPAARIAVMEDSLRCLAYGWLSLVPLLGVGPVISAVRLFRRVDREASEWNPAHHLWLRGLVLASFGFWANLFWWGLFVVWLGSVAGTDPPDGSGQGDSILLLLYVLLFGSAPTLFGLSCAAARWPTAFGAFVKRYRSGLLALMGVAYVVLLQVVCLYESEHGGNRFSVRLSSDLALHGLLTIWLVWVLGGFMCLAWRGVKSWWWLAWLAGAAGFTFWLTAV